MSDLHSETSVAYVRTETVPPSAPPASTTGLQGWMRENLFPTPLQSVLTIIMGALAAYILWLVLEFAVVNAVFTGENGEACRGEGNQDGACWAMAKARFGQWIYGFYPFAERWRVNIVFLLGVLALVPMLIPSLPYKKFNAIFLLGIYPIITLILLTGGNFDITGSTWLTTFVFVAAIVLPIWGGLLLLTLVVAIVGLLVVSLTLGHRCWRSGRRVGDADRQDVLHRFIEFWRGVPLITVLFMASVMLPLFLPRAPTSTSCCAR
jgi:general L-amino acid transport system permease protein